MATGLASAMPAQTDVTMTLNVDHADRITLTYYDLSYNEVVVEGLKDGDNELTIPVGSWSKSVNVIAKDGFGLESCTFTNPGAQEENCYIQYMTRSYFDASADPSTEGAVWKVRTFDFAEKRTAHATINIDNAAKVTVVRKESNTTVNLVNGANDVTFIPAEGDNSGETVFSINPTDYYQYFYKVLVNGSEPEDFDLGGSDLTIADGDVITVESEYPDIEVPVHFTYTDGAFGFVTKVISNGEETEFDGHIANIKCGSKVEFIYDEENYILNSIKINNEPVDYPWSPMSLGTVAKETYVEIDARKVGSYTFDVIVNDASLVKLQAFEDDSSIYYGGVEIPLVSGENRDVQVSDKRHFFSITGKTRSELTGLVLNGVKIEQIEKTDYWGETYAEWPFPIEINQGDVLEITGSGPQRGNTAVLYVDKIPEGSYSFDFNMNGYKPEVVAGYNLLKFDDNDDAEIGDIPFNIDLIYSPMASWCYVNETPVETYYSSESANSYKLTSVADNTVIKLFTDSEPATYSVTMHVPEVLTDKISVRKDFVTEVAYPENGFKVLGPTMLTISINDGKDIRILVNGDDVTSDNGECSILADKDTKIDVQDLSTLAIGQINEDHDLHRTNEIYNLQGMKVSSKASNLPHGVYIINGKKVKL